MTPRQRLALAIFKEAWDGAWGVRRASYMRRGNNPAVHYATFDVLLRRGYVEWVHGSNCYLGQLTEAGLERAKTELSVPGEEQRVGGETPESWTPGDKCLRCGSTNTGWDMAEGAFCRSCGGSDSDE